MLPPFLEDRAALYVSGAMTAVERENFELILKFHDELRTLVARLCNVVGELALAANMAVPAPAAELKNRILASLGPPPPPAEPEALVVTNPDGQVEWLSEAFTNMCGFTLKELKGRKPGHLLQGDATDRLAVQRIRSALLHKRSCRETLVNYHKNGSDYVVDVRIVPVLDDDDRPLWFIAQERKLAEPDARVLAP